MTDSEVTCKRCGWKGRYRDLTHVTVREDFGDVCCSKCPRCGEVERDGMSLFEEREVVWK